MGVDKVLDAMEFVLAQRELRVVGAGLPGETRRAQMMLSRQPGPGQELAEFDPSPP
ncbi:hypothetical protein [Nocardia amikacinitolerans]|uniref:hypothetical protein n=1 Tax=Nocardia amikacinitolerans TaxID=756689 RepID=UPI0012ED156F|nr:hypothetical protein [Nocardia amikacinitolerans]